MRTSCQVGVYPLVNEAWWKENVAYSKFRRQGIDIVCASFKHEEPKANVVFITGLTESFVKYSETIQFLYEQGFNVFTYDHQSQGLSGRWLTESQSLWINTFDDYVDDFVYFLTTISKESPKLPNYLVAHSMGGLIGSIAMSRLPSLISRAVLCAPMFRNKCGLKCYDYKHPLPQPITYYITYLACYAGLGAMHAIGFFKEKPTDRLSTNVFTSNNEQLNNWMAMRMRFPSLISTCVTNDWVLKSIRAQKKFSSRYKFVKTNTLILSAEHDFFVYNRAMADFAKKAPNSKLLYAPDTYHELLLESPAVQKSCFNVIGDFFSQDSDDVTRVMPQGHLQLYDLNKPMYSLPEMLFRTVGIVVAALSFSVGLAMLLGDRGKIRVFG